MSAQPKTNVSGHLVSVSRTPDTARPVTVFVRDGCAQPASTVPAHTAASMMPTFLPFWAVETVIPIRRRPGRKGSFCCRCPASPPRHPSAEHYTGLHRGPEPDPAPQRRAGPSAATAHGCPVDRKTLMAVFKANSKIAAEIGPADGFVDIQCAGNSAIRTVTPTNGDEARVLFNYDARVRRRGRRSTPAAGRLPERRSGAGRYCRPALPMIDNAAPRYPLLDKSST